MTAALLLLLVAAPEASMTRGDFARAYLRFERTRALHPPADRARVSRRFDEVTLAFFRGGRLDALAALEDLTASLRPDGAVAPGWFVRVSPAVRGDDDPAPSTVTLERWRRDDARRWTLVLADAEGAAVRSWPVGETRSFALEPPGPGTWRFALRDVEGSAFPVAALHVLPRAPRALRTGWEARLAEADAPPGAATVFRARADLLVADPGGLRAAELLADPPRLARALASELAAIEAGRDPYRGRAGSFWRVVAHGGYEIPMRVYAPGDARPGERFPLVIALHGAGGDENLWFFGYGAGRLRELAHAARCVVLTPGTYAMMTADEHLDALVDAAAAAYPVDPARVTLIGHSLGGMVASRLARERPDRLAGVVCLAGALPGPFPVPTRVYAGGVDPLVPVGRLRPVVRDAAAGGDPVRLLVREHEGHTLLVDAVLDEAFAWLMERERAR